MYTAVMHRAIKLPRAHHFTPARCDSLACVAPGTSPSFVRGMLPGASLGSITMEEGEKLFVGQVDIENA